MYQTIASFLLLLFGALNNISLDTILIHENITDFIVHITNKFE